VVARLSCPIQTGPQTYPASCKMSSGPLVPWVRQPKSGLYQTPPPLGLSLAWGLLIVTVILLSPPRACLASFWAAFTFHLSCTRNVSGYENQTFALLRCYATYVCSCIPTYQTAFRSHLQGSVLLIVEVGTESLFRNVGDEFPNYA